MRIAEYLSENKSNLQFNNNNIEIEIFNSAVLKQSKHSEGKFSFENILQAIYLFLNLARRVRLNNFDIIHFNTSAQMPLLKDQIILLFISLITSKRIFIQIHYCGIEETFLKNNLLRWLQIVLLKRLSKIIVLSKKFKNELVEAGISNDKLYVLYNFHNEKYNHSKVNTHNEIQLLFIGSISERKGFQDLLESLKILRNEYNLNVLGEFSSKNFKEYCEKTVASNNLRVNFLGYLNGQKKNEIISNSDVLILPSYAEGFPMVIPEAMALGNAIISTSIAAMPEIIEADINGYLISPGQYKILAQKILYLNNNKNILKEFKENSIKLSEKFSFENYINNLSVIYKD